MLCTHRMSQTIKLDVECFSSAGVTKWYNDHNVHYAHYDKLKESKSYEESKCTITSDKVILKINKSSDDPIDPILKADDFQDLPPSVIELCKTGNFK